MKNIYFSLFILICLLFSCRSSTLTTEASTTATSDHTTDTSLPEWAKDAVIYEVNMRQFTSEGSFNSFTEHIPRLKELGVDILWFMPLHPISKKNRKGSLGSYYAVSDYKKVNSEYGTVADFDNMVKSIHEHDMHIIIDWVPNHTGWDHHWITEHTDWYTQNDKGEVIDPIDPGTGESWGWTDVADLNYDNQDMRNEMVSDMMYWLRERNIDGFRQDVAHNVPDEFWEQVRDSVFSIGRPVFMLAEAEMQHHRNSESFHASYGWSFHHLLNEIARGDKTASEIPHWITEDATKFTDGFHMHFTSNHDENSWSGTVFERMKDSHQTMAALTFLMQGMPLIYGGQEEPLSKRLLFFEKDDIEFGDYEYSDFYKSLISLKHDNEALWNGEYGGDVDTQVLDNDVLLIKRNKGNNVVTGLFNLSENSTEVNIKENIGGKMFGSDMNVSLGDNSSVHLDSWEYRIFSK